MNSKRLKRFSLILLILTVFVICCASTTAFLWYGGYVKNWTCRVVTGDSDIYKSLKCDNLKNVSNADNTNTENSLEKSNDIEQESQKTALSIVDIVEDSSRAVVGIGVDVEKSSEQGVIGTGFLVSGSGLIITNRHVVENESYNFVVIFKGVEQPINIDKKSIFRDPVNDIAIIKIDATKLPKSIKPLVLGDSDNIKVGESVIAIGNPLGEFVGTVTKGIVSGLNREVKIAQGFFPSATQGFQGVIQTDAAINPGNSGGPLINLRGEVIGINFATVEGAANLSFALPINWVKQRMSEVEEFGKFKVPFIGIEYQTKVLFVNGQTLVGAEVISLVEDGPAMQAGLKVKDVIVSFDDMTLNNDSLAGLIQKKKIGDEVGVVVYRNKEQVELNVVIGER